MNDTVLVSEKDSEFFKPSLDDGLFLVTEGANHPLPEDFLCPDCEARLFTSGDIDWTRYDQPDGPTKTLESPNYDNNTGKLTCACGFTTGLRLFSWRR